MLVLRLVISELSARFVVIDSLALDNKYAIASLALPDNIESESDIETDSVMVLYLTMVLETASEIEIDSENHQNDVNTLAKTSDIEIDSVNVLA